MKQARSILNLVVAATLTFTSTGAFAQDMDALLQQLADPANDRWQRVQRQILRDWEDSGSAALDYIFQRGKAALDAGDAETAVNPRARSAKLRAAVRTEAPARNSNPDAALAGMPRLMTR